MQCNGQCNISAMHAEEMRPAPMRAQMRPLNLAPRAFLLPLREASRHTSVTMEKRAENAPAGSTTPRKRQG